MKKNLLTKSFLIGSGFALGLVAVTVAAVTVGTVKTWTTGETLTAADLNSTVTSLKTALEAIPNWTKSGANAVYTDGNVGIGTTNPTFPLHVKAPPGTDVMKLQSANGNNIIWFKDLSDVAQGYVGYGSGNQFHVYQAQASSLVFHTNGQARATIDSSGKVGIGTATPLYLLHVSGDAGPAAANTAFVNTNANGLGVYIQSAGTANDKYALNVTGNAGATPGLYVSNAGNVGIGTQILGYPLTMGSGAYVTTGGVWTNASSREYKENLQDLTAEEALAAVMALAPQKFNYKKDKGDCPPSASDHRRGASLDAPSDRADLKIRPYEERASQSGGSKDPPLRDFSLRPCPPEQYVGFVAEDVPDLVATNDRKGLSAMDLVAVLTKVVQEQQGQIEKQQNRIEAMEARLNGR